MYEELSEDDEYEEPDEYVEVLQDEQELKSNSFVYPYG